jgi:hypothetical protein
MKNDITKKKKEKYSCLQHTRKKDIKKKKQATE